MNIAKYTARFLCKSTNNIKPMIGDSIFYSDEAYNIWINFLKEYKYFGKYIKILNTLSNGNCQSYNSFFKQWSQSVVRFTEIWNAHSREGRRYYWTEDHVLLMPFLSYGLHMVKPYEKLLIEIIEMWGMYCAENNISTSFIKINEDFKQNETVNNTRYTWKDILEGYNYPSHEFM